MGLISWLFGKTRQRRYNKDAKQAKKVTKQRAKEIQKWQKRTK
jgi:hypothetical protein